MWTRRQLPGLIGFSVSPVLGAQAPRDRGASRMLLCGGNVVYDAQLLQDQRGPRWADIRSWRPERSVGLPRSYALNPFATTDDCKPIDGGQSVLVTSSAGGVAIYRRDTFETSFYATVGNAHSACLLPDGHLVVAASTHPQGNALVLFHRSEPEKECFRTPLYSAHGVEWDAERRILYAVGMDAVEEYQFSAGSGGAALRKVRESKLPSRGGHELSPAPDGRLIVSTETEVFWFGKDTRQFEKHPGLGNMHHVKSISVHPASGQCAYVRADEGVWWTFQLRFLNPVAEVESPGQRLYKVRWA